MGLRDIRETYEALKAQAEKGDTLDVQQASDVLDMLGEMIAMVETPPTARLIDTAFARLAEAETCAQGLFTHNHPKSDAERHAIVASVCAQQVVLPFVQAGTDIMQVFRTTEACKSLSALLTRADAVIRKAREERP